MQLVRPEGGVARGAPFLFEIRVYIGIETNLVLRTHASALFLTTARGEGGETAAGRNFSKGASGRVPKRSTPKPAR